MDYRLDDDQREIQAAVGKLLERHAGPARARAVAAGSGTDRELLAALEEAGYLDLFRYDRAGPLNATLAVEQIASAAGLAPAAQRMLVAPALIEGDLPRAVVVVDRADPGPVRYAADADLLIAIDGDRAVVARAGEWTATRLKSQYGYPFARVALNGGRPLGTGSAAVARRWWQVAIAIEAAGAARSALDMTVKYLCVRTQFGRALGANQALQHRLAECHVSIEGVSWLARQAAWRGTDEAAAAAAIAAAEMAGRVLLEMHQMSGAIGFTTEYDLHLFTMRLEALRVEAGGVHAHADDFARARWAV
ncbi:MAG: acyl-CoA dehydrogenase family protein [Gammaproteobacteria bacterium]